MDITEKQLAEIAGQFEEEGSPRAQIAPLRSIAVAPEQWRSVLSDPRPEHAVFEKLWRPLGDILPETLELLRKTLCAVGFLTTDHQPHSLLYLFRKGEEIYAMRGLSPHEIRRTEASQLPQDFLRFYALHDGWIDIYSQSNGPAPSKDWFYLSEIIEDDQAEELKDDFDPRRFLAVFHNGAASFVGFDLAKAPPLCFICWKSDPPEIVPGFWEAADPWIAQYLEFFDPQRK